MKTETTPAIQTPWLTTAAAAMYLQISVSQIRKLVRNDLLKSKRVNPDARGKMIFHREWLDNYGQSTANEITLDKIVLTLENEV